MSNKLHRHMHYVLIMAVLAQHSLTAIAEPITYTFMGPITSIEDLDGELDGSVVLGVNISGSFTVDPTSITDTDGSSSTGKYPSDGAPFGIAIVFGNYVLENDPAPNPNPDLETAIHDDVYLGGVGVSDAWRVQTRSSIVTPSTLTGPLYGEVVIGFGNTDTYVDHSFRLPPDLSTLQVGSLPLIRVARIGGGLDIHADLTCLSATEDCTVPDIPGLIDNGDGTVTDADVCLMWAEDANLAGRHLGHPAAQSFANNETLAGHSDWRLPDALNFDGTGPCVTVGGVEGVCSESELGHLYFTELGNPEGGPLANTGPFDNMRPVQYWTGTSVGPGWAYEFSFLVGSQNNALNSDQNRVLIVRDLVDPAIGCAAQGPSQCSDGVDNDGNGLIDYPDDTGCCDANDATEGVRYLRGEFTRGILNAIPRDIGSYFQNRPIDAARFQVDFSTVFLCRKFVPELENLPLPICFDGPITTGAPQECPPLDCLVDGPGCLDPYGFQQIAIPNEALHAFAQLIEGQLSDRDFDTQIKSMVADGRITLDAREPTKTRYLPRISLTSGFLLALVIIALLAFAYASGRKRPS